MVKDAILKLNEIVVSSPTDERDSGQQYNKWMLAQVTKAYSTFMWCWSYKWKIAWPSEWWDHSGLQTWFLKIQTNELLCTKRELCLAQCVCPINQSRSEKYHTNFYKTIFTDKVKVKKHHNMTIEQRSENHHKTTKQRSENHYQLI